MPESTAAAPESTNDKPKQDTPCPPSDPCDTKAEALVRKRKQIAAARDSFKSSREFLTRTQMSSSERLIRFYEGIIESLRGECVESSYEEAVHAFDKVVRYGLDVEIHDQRKNRNDKLQDRLLFLQAHHNIAVMNHRKWLAITREQTNPEPAKTGSTTRVRSAEELERNAVEAYKEAHLHYETVLVRRFPETVTDALFPSLQIKAEPYSAKPTDAEEKARVEMKARVGLEGGYAALFLASSFGLLELIVQGRLRWNDNATPQEPKTNDFLDVAVLFRLTSLLCELALALELWQRACNAFLRWNEMPGQISMQREKLKKARQRRRGDLRWPPKEWLYFAIRKLFRFPDPLRISRLEDTKNRLVTLERESKALDAEWKNREPQFTKLINGFRTDFIGPILTECESARALLYTGKPDASPVEALPDRVGYAVAANELYGQTDTMDELLEQTSLKQPDSELEHPGRKPHEFMIDQKDYSAQIASRIRSELKLFFDTTRNTIATDPETKLPPEKTYKNVRSELRLTEINFAFKRK